MVPSGDAARSRPQQLDNIVRALSNELDAAQRDRGTPQQLEDGKRVHEDAEGATYRFSLIYDSVIPEGQPVKLVVGDRRWRAEVSYKDGLSLLIAIDRPEDTVMPAETVPSATLLADPWYLLEELRKRTVEQQQRDTWSRPAAALLDRLASRGELPMPIESAEPANLNREQRQAVASCAAIRSGSYGALPAPVRPPPWVSWWRTWPAQESACWLLRTRT